MGTLILMVIVYLAVIILIIASCWKVYSKAGKPGWACLIPIYNIIVFLQIVGKPWWWLFLLCIPIVNLIVGIYLTHLLSLSFGKGVGFTIGLIFLNIIFLPILAFGSSQYVGPAGASKKDENPIY